MNLSQETVALPVQTGTTIETKSVASVTRQTTEALKDIVFGSAAGTVGKIIEYPFDTVKVRLQSQPEHLPLQYTGPLDCFRQSIQRDGLRGLYRGISAPLAGAAIETSSLFLSVWIEFFTEMDFPMLNFTTVSPSSRSPASHIPSSK